MNGMRAISLWQPWATAMCVARPGLAKRLKTFETRSWQPDPAVIGQRLAICAAKTQVDPDSREKLSDWWMGNVKRKGGYRACFEKAGFTDWTDLPFGKVVCHGVLARVVPTEQLLARAEADGIEQDWGNYGAGRFGWELTDVEVLPVPVPIVGRQGIFWWEGVAA